MRSPVSGPNKNVYRQLVSGEATRLLRQASVQTYQHKDYRHAFITVLRNIKLSPGVRDTLVERIKTKRSLPAWISESAARCLGNSLDMWRSTYDHGEAPVDAETTEMVLNEARKHLLHLSSLGKQVGEQLPDGLRDPEDTDIDFTDLDATSTGATPTIDEESDREHTDHQQSSSADGVGGKVQVDRAPVPDTCTSEEWSSQ
jgi:hypothetical protein